MSYIVFTQSEDGFVDTTTLIRHAEHFFDASLKLVSHTPGERDRPSESRFAFRSGGTDAAFTLRVREAKRADHRVALDAEARGQVPGMAALAEHCAHVWEVEADEATPPHAQLLFCALLASVALGPILPPNASTLLGVRSARAMAEKPEMGFRG